MAITLGYEGGACDSLVGVASWDRAEEMEQICIKTVEMHTGGEAVRLIVSGECVC